METDYWWSWFWRRLHGETSNPARTYVAEGMTYKAFFVEGPIFRIDSNVDPVTVVADGWERPTPVAFAADRFPGSTTVTVKPIQESRRSYRHRFRSWSDGGDVTHPVEVPRTADKTLTLTLDTEYRLSTDGWYGHEVGTVPSSEDDFYREGTVVRLRAAEGPPEDFIGWSGDATGTEPVASVVMDTGRHVEAVFAAGTREVQFGDPIAVSLRWNEDESDFDRRYVRVPPAARELEVEFRTRSRSEGAEAGLFLTHLRDPWPWDVQHENADRVLRDGVVTMTIPRPPDRWPAACFILIRGAALEGTGTRALEGTLVASVTGDTSRNRPPQAVGTLENRTLGASEGALVMDVARVFSDTRRGTC